MIVVDIGHLYTVTILVTLEIVKTLETTGIEQEHGVDVKL